MQTINLQSQNILLLSDTHGKHRLLDIPKNIQIVIHCGDICNGGMMQEIVDFFDWYSQLNIPYKIFVAGNHDLPFELEPQISKKLIPRNVIWLCDSTIQILEITIKAVSPFFYFTENNQTEKIDILLSHQPPWGILDNKIGCKELRKFVLKIKPLYHIFGHNHNGFGTKIFKNIHFVNASLYHKLCLKENQ